MGGASFRGTHVAFHINPEYLPALHLLTGIPRPGLAAQVADGAGNVAAPVVLKGVPENFRYYKDKRDGKIYHLGRGATPREGAYNNWYELGNPANKIRTNYQDYQTHFDPHVVDMPITLDDSMRFQDGNGNTVDIVEVGNGYMKFSIEGPRFAGKQKG